jgi:peptide/nickel transport system substrate-binding protein
MSGAPAGIALALILLVTFLVLPARTAPPPIQRPMEIVEARTEGDGPLTVDPAACYDVASAELLMNVYDTLIVYDGEHVDKYLPQLATEWLVKENSPPTHDPETGLDWYYTYYFKVRQGVPFQNPTFGNLTAEDVEYCFERAMVIDFLNGPQWMFYDPLLNGASHNYVNRQEVDPVNNVTDRIMVGKMIDHSVESNSTHVWFNLAFPGAYAPFLQILCMPWSSIYSKTWANSLGRNNWNGTWGYYTHWTAFTAPDVAPFDEPTPAVMGTGPFKLANLDQNLQYWDANRFTGYWRGWGNGPAPNYGIGWPASGSSKPAGYVDHFKVTWAYDWPTRSTMFLNGEVDFCAVPSQYIGQMVNQPNIRCTYPLQDAGVWVAFYQYDINATSPYSQIYDYGVIGELGVPRDFFGNATYGMYMRKAFSHCINFTSLLDTVFLGEAIQPTTALVPTLPYYNASISKYDFNLTEAAELFRQWPGLWDTGFTINLLYNIGTSTSSVLRKTLSEMLATNINSLNPKFHVRSLELDLDSFWLARTNRQLPMFIAGWLVDYPDPHDFAAPYYTAWSTIFGTGTSVAGVPSPAWTVLQGFHDAIMDSLVEQGIRMPDGPARAQIYSQIQQRVIDLCPSIALYTPVHRHFEQTWVCGWYYNPIQGDSIYAANIWKWYYTPHAQVDTVTNDTANLLPCDVNYDGRVNIVDIAMVAQAFGSSYGPPIDPRWQFRADINNDRVVNIIDIAAVASNFGKTSAIWTPSP